MDRQKFSVRRAVMEDMPELRRIFAAARVYMKANGNPTQWGDSSPAERVVTASIGAGECWLMELEGRPRGTFCVQEGEEPTYRSIQEGAWPDDSPYLTIHRVASDGTCRGIMDTCLAFCQRNAELGLFASNPRSIRIDTHRSNAVMHHLLNKHGFTRCGIIHVADGSQRIAYQRTLPSCFGMK